MREWRKRTEMYEEVVGLRIKVSKGKKRSRAWDVPKIASSLGRGTCLKSSYWDRVLAKCVRRDWITSISAPMDYHLLTATASRDLKTAV